MKLNLKKSLLAVSVLSTLLFSACGSSSSEDKANEESPTDKVGTTPDSANDKTSDSNITKDLPDANIADTADALNQKKAEKAILVVSDINNIMPNGVPEFTSSRSISRTYVEYTNDCSHGGSHSYTGDQTDTTSDLVNTYINCSDGERIVDGVSQNYVSTDGDISTYSSSATNFKTSRGNYFTIKNLDVTGVTDYKDYSSNKLFNGNIAYNLADKGEGSIDYSNFRHIVDGNSYVTLSGDVSIKSSINPCSNGTYNLNTVEPLISSGEGFMDGKIVVNGDTYDFQGEHVTIIFKDGTSSEINQNAQTGCKE